MKRYFNFNGIGSQVFHALRPHGCSAVLGIPPERINCGYGPEAWSPPTLVVHGVDRKTAEPIIAAHGWTGAVEYR